jgi:hypothetical protein
MLPNCDVFVCDICLNHGTVSPGHVRRQKEEAKRRNYASHSWLSNLFLSHSLVCMEKIPYMGRPSRAGSTHRALTTHNLSPLSFHRNLKSRLGEYAATAAAYSSPLSSFLIMVPACRSFETPWTRPPPPGNAGACRQGTFRRCSTG